MATVNLEYLVKRQHLYQASLDSALRAGAEIKANPEVAAAKPEDELVPADGRFRADLMIGANGMRSHVQDSLG
jgi:2-polyprenyl-6-methoxyphenol hydroxylase-like FAD-dependent oxidoreductase